MSADVDRTPAVTVDGAADVNLALQWLPMGLPTSIWPLWQPWTVLSTCVLLYGVDLIFLDFFVTHSFVFAIRASTCRYVDVRSFFSRAIW